MKLKRALQFFLKKVKEPIVLVKKDNVNSEVVTRITNFIVSQQQQLDHLHTIEDNLNDSMEKLCSVCSMHIVEEHKSCSERSNLIDEEVLTYKQGNEAMPMTKCKRVKMSNNVKDGVKGTPDRTPNPFQGKVKSMR